MKDVVPYAKQLICAFVETGDFYYIHYIDTYIHRYIHDNNPQVLNIITIIKLGKDQPRTTLYKYNVEEEAEQEEEQLYLLRSNKRGVEGMQ